MGKPRGQRNASREKSWPGADAAQVRAFKHDGVTNWESVEEAANALLGEEPVEYSFKFGPHTPFSLGGKPFADPDVRKISSAPIERKKLKAHNGTCSNCSHPIYAFNGLCRTCYRTAAKEKYEEKVVDRQERTVGYKYWADMSSAFERPSGHDNGKDAWELIRVQEDFAPGLIDAIGDVEFEQDKPFVFIRPPEERSRKPLYFSNDAGERMFSHRQESARIKYRRPRWKTIRGEWA